MYTNQHNQVSKSCITCKLSTFCDTLCDVYVTTPFTYHGRDYPELINLIVFRYLLSDKLWIKNLFINTVKNIPYSNNSSNLLGNKLRCRPFWKYGTWSGRTHSHDDFVSSFIHFHEVCDPNSISVGLCLKDWTNVKISR